MSALSAIMYREGKIRATNLTFIFWDLFYPLGYLLVFGVGMTQAMGMKPPGIGVDYNAFFLAGVLGMASFGIASNTARSFFMDRDNGIFYEMLTYPMRRAEYLLGKGLFNLAVVRMNPAAPAAATGITQTGVYVGALAGPVLFGVLVEAHGYPLAWVLAACSSAGAAGGILYGRSRVQAWRALAGTS